jgi:hypothetical protein
LLSDNDYTGSMLCVAGTTVMPNPRIPVAANPSQSIMRETATMSSLRMPLREAAAANPRVREVLTRAAARARRAHSLRPPTLLEVATRVSTADEQLLFWELLAEVQSGGNIPWQLFMARWNQEVAIVHNSDMDTRQIQPKSIPQLQQHLKKFVRAASAQQSRPSNTLHVPGTSSIGLGAAPAVAPAATTALAPPNLAVNIVQVVSPAVMRSGPMGTPQPPAYTQLLSSNTGWRELQPGYPRVPERLRPSNAWRELMMPDGKFAYPCKGPDGKQIRYCIECSAELGFGVRFKGHSKVCPKARGKSGPKPNVMRTGG